MTFDLPNESCVGQREEVPDKGYSTGYFIVRPAKIKILAPQWLAKDCLSSRFLSISQHVDDREQTYQPQDSQLRTCDHDWIMLYQRYVSGNKKYFLGNMSGKFV
jgi:hypothetical protein